jgi:hypothetical protein
MVAAVVVPGQVAAQALALLEPIDRILNRRLLGSSSSDFMNSGFVSTSESS